MYKILRLALVLLVIVATNISGCKGQKQQKPAPPPLSIGVTVIMDGFKEIMEPFKKELQVLAKERKVRLTWREAKDPTEQEKHFKELLKQKPKAILGFMPDPNEANKLSQKAKEQDVRLMAVGILPPNTPLDGFVGIDARRVGEQQGNYLIKALKDKPQARVLILMTDPDNPTEQELLKGNRQSLQSGNGLEIIEREMPKSDVPLGLNKIWEELGALDGLITHEEKATKAVMTSLAGQPFKPISIGIGAGREMAQLIAGGEHQGEVDLEPEVMARYAFEAAYNLAKTGEWDFDTWVDNGPYHVPIKYGPSRIITRENLSLLQPRHGTIKAKSSASFSGAGNSEGGQGQDAKGGQEGQGSKQESKGSKIKVKLKEGKEIEFHVPGEIEGIEIEGKVGGGKEKAEGGEQGQEQKGSGGEKGQS